MLTFTFTVRVPRLAVATSLTPNPILSTMPQPLRLMAVLAHPDDESLGFGGTLAKYSAEGVETFLVTATSGDRGRLGDHRFGTAGHPGGKQIARIRETELREAAVILGVRDLSLLGYPDGHLDEVDPREIIRRIVALVRRVRPDVVITFAPDGGYGHPDHIAISQFAGAALVAAADPGHIAASGSPALAPHAVAKLYHLVSPRSAWDIYQAAFKKLVSTVDGVERHAVPWPDWEITTTLDAREQIANVWRAVCCHKSQIENYTGLWNLEPADHAELWGRQHFYRAYSTVNGGRRPEHDLFEGVRDTDR